MRHLRLLAAVLDSPTRSLRSFVQLLLVSLLTICRGDSCCLLSVVRSTDLAGSTRARVKCDRLVISIEGHKEIWRSRRSVERNQTAFWKKACSKKRRQGTPTYDNLLLLVCYNLPKRSLLVPQSFYLMPQTPQLFSFFPPSFFRLSELVCQQQEPLCVQ